MPLFFLHSILMVDSMPSVADYYTSLIQIATEYTKNKEFKNVTP
jgi:hypothetical protein